MLTSFKFWSDDHPLLASVLIVLVGFALTYPIAWFMGHPNPALIAATLPVALIMFVGLPLMFLFLLLSAALGHR